MQYQRHNGPTAAWGVQSRLHAARTPAVCILCQSCERRYGVEARVEGGDFADCALALQHYEQCVIEVEPTSRTCHSLEDLREQPLVLARQPPSVRSLSINSRARGASASALSSQATITLASTTTSRGMVELVAIVDGVAAERYSASCSFPLVPVERCSCRIPLVVHGGVNADTVLFGQAGEGSNEGDQLGTKMSWWDGSVRCWWCRRGGCHTCNLPRHVPARRDAVGSRTRRVAPAITFRP